MPSHLPTISETISVHFEIRPISQSVAAVTSTRVQRLVLAALASAVIGACGQPDYLSTEELMDPQTCQDCHPKHYREWSGSMHAYAADDPVFLAMNQRGQDETDGELGDFCVKCHAPMAVHTGATVDGLNLAELPQSQKGVTCYFCHNVKAVEGTHNNPLVLADDKVMRGGVSDPVANDAHPTAYSTLHDRNSMESSALCGSCHDIVTQAGVHLERTFSEWQETVFASDIPQAHLSCSKCHMVGDVDGVIADVPGVPLRKPKDHAFPGVDVALTEWPEIDAQLMGIERDLFAAVTPKLCAEPPGPLSFTYILDNVFAGHMLPTGAAADRRGWVEIIAYDDSDQVVFQSGVVAEGQPVAELPGLGDDQLWQIRDFARDGSGAEAHMFWDVREVDSQLLLPAVTNDPGDPRFSHSVQRTYNMVLASAPARVTARMRLRPVGLDVLDDLIASGHLDAVYRDRIRTFDLVGTALEWRTDHGLGCIDPTTP